MVAWEESLEGEAQNPSPHGYPSPSHLSERRLSGAVRATAAITTTAITRSSLKCGREARPLPLLVELPRGGCLSLSASAPAQSVQCQTGRCLRLLSRDRHHFRVQLPPFLSEPPQPPAPGFAAARR